MKAIRLKLFSTLLCVSLLLSFTGVQPAYASATIMVNSNADTVANNGVCTLREAIINANSNNQSGSTDCIAGSAGADTIIFAANYTITLVGSQLPVVTTQISILGNGAANTTVQASSCNPVTKPGGCSPATYRVFQVNETGNLSLANLTVRHGNCAGGCATPVDQGGGIYNQGVMTVTNSIILGSSATFLGGGMYNEVSSPAISNVTFSGNFAPAGGALYNNYSNPTLTNVIFNSNSASNAGAGIYNNHSAATLTNLTFMGNSATYGGGMYNNNSSSPILKNVTFSGNSATYGGGIYNITSSPTLTNVTLSGNSASNTGGGVYNTSSSPILKNVIIANSVSGGDCVNASGALNAASSNNLIEDGAKACNLTNGVNANIIGSDPKLGPLANNGGYTQTFALSAGSPAIDTGTNTGCPSTDQRGKTRPQGSLCDIGAFEFATIFADVPYTYWAWQPIERLYNAGITGGCSTNPLNYCPESQVTRVQMALFLLKGIHGASYTPPPVGGSTGFADVAITYWAAAWIKELAAEGITGGCGNGNFCPDGLVTRAQMSIFLLKAEHGSAYSPPAVGSSTGFADVPTTYWAAAWVKQLAAEGVTGGCGGGNFCPDALVTRAQMAVFLVKNFNLP